MQLIKFIPIKLTALLIVGILLGHLFKFNLYFIFYSTIFSIVVLGILYKRTSRNNTFLFGSTVALITIILGILITIKTKPGVMHQHYSNHTDINQNTLVLKINDKLKSNSFSTSYFANVISTNNRQTCGQLLLKQRKDSTFPNFYIDNEIIIVGTLDSIGAPLNPHQFNYKNYLKNKGIVHQIEVTKANHIKKKSATKTLYGLASFIRNNSISKLKAAGFESDQLSIIQALFFGQKDDISKTTYDNYKDAGAVHILAVSGLHIGILLLFLQFLLQPLERLPKGRQLKLGLIVILLWGFAFLAGLSASIVRAVTMFSFVAFAMHLNRPQNTYNVLALSIFFILLVYNPLLLFDVGFQLSYAAVFSIVWIYPLLQRAWHPKNWVLQKSWQLLSVSIAAQIGVLPISLYYFHQFPGLFFISNLVIVPVLGILIGLGILIIGLILMDLAPSFLIGFYNTLIGSMNRIIQWIAQQEAFVFRNITFDGFQLVLSYILIFSSVLFLTRPKFKRFAILILSIGLLQGWHLYRLNTTMKKDQLMINHQIKNTILFYQTGNELTLYSNDSSAAQSMLTAYLNNERITHTKYKALKNRYTYKNKKLVIIDSTKAYLKTDSHVDYILLTHSPKVHLERLIDSLKPTLIISDGSSYSNYIDQWRKTCSKKKLPFHYTGEKGAFIIE